MPKIKNWSKMGKNTWINDTSKERSMMGMSRSTEVTVKKVPGGWKTNFKSPTNPKSKVFDTKKKALNKAYSYMRSNPDG